MDSRKTETDFAPGTVIGGRYRVRGITGRGGMSVVYLVWDEKLEKQWAMKTVGKESREDGRLCRQSMAAEISLLVRLRHPGLPRIIDVIDDGTYLSVVMDYIEGETLLDIVKKNGPQDQETSVRWAIELAGVLQFLHSQEPPVIYRDMKPGNVMLCPDGRLVLFDFGIAREYKASGTEDTICLGTVGYAAPEQFGGRGQTDVRTDIYGLGATLYHLVTGRDPAQPPYELVPVRTVRKELSSGLESVIAKCTRRDPDERYQSCTELISALRRYRDLDAQYLRTETKKLMMFGAALTAAFLLTCSGFALRAKMRREIRMNYAYVLKDAADLAGRSLASGVYDQKVADRYLEAADLMPEGEEAYIGLLNYGCDMAETAPALTAVCARIDSGIIPPERSGELLYTAAELWFSGNEADPDFRRDYRKAARYFSMIDAKEYPEAGECAVLASALGVFGRDVRWDETAAALKAFARRCAEAPPGRRRIRNLMLGAGIYAANRLEFQHIGTDAEAEAASLWKMALAGAEELISEGQDAEDLREKALYGLAGIWKLSKETAGDAASCYMELAESASGKEKRRLLLEEADALIRAEDDAGVRYLFDHLMSEYPKDKDIYLRYCTWLLETGDAEAAADIWKRGNEICGLQGGANFEELKKRTAGIG